MSVPEADLGRLRRRGFWLEGMSMAWTVMAAAVAITAGVITSSIALIGLGPESGLDLPVLDFAMRRAGLALSSGALPADAAETGTGGWPRSLPCSARAWMLVVGGPAAGLVIAVLVVAEAIEIWRHRR